MKKRLSLSIILILTLFFAFTMPVFAANIVSDINIDVVLYDDGSAYITQTWNCLFSEGTEVYLPVENLGELTISDFSVSDSNGTYTYVDNWDVGASFKEKANKCGINKTDKGIELCWGITEYGKRRYAAEYKVTGLVGAYSDYDGFNFQFVNSGMGTLPTDATVKIVTQNGTLLSKENCGIWAFGFEGQINFDEGKIIAYTENPLSSQSDSVIVMVQLNKGILSPSRTVESSFETVRNQAFEGSDYDASSGGESYDDNTLTNPIEIFFASLSFLLPLLIIGLVLFFGIKRWLSIKKLYKQAEYFREVPILGDFEAVQALAKRFGQSNNDGNLIAAAFIKLISTGCLEPMSETSVGFFGNEKQTTSLRIVKPPEAIGLTAILLYDLLLKACGPDFVLQEKELDKYCSINYEAMISLVKDAKQNGEESLVKYQCYLKGPTSQIKKLSDTGKAYLLQIMGFKKYLLDFSLIGERTISESIIWQDFLAFAALLGIADKAMEQFRKIYPTVTPYQQNAEGYYYLAYRYHHASYRAAVNAQTRASGGGGSSSSGGGGGFSGGGSGGGTR